MENAVITVGPGFKKVGVRISDGIHISLRGSMSKEDLLRFLEEVSQFNSGDEEGFVNIARKYGLGAPRR